MYMHSISANCETFTLFILSIFVKSTFEQYIIEVMTTILNNWYSVWLYIFKLLIFLKFSKILQWEPRPGGFQAVLQCDATGADFGGEIPMLSFDANETGCAYFTTPEDSCQDTFNNRTGCINYYAVVPRGNCSFSEKAYHAQRGYPYPYSALIIFNDDGHSPVPMAGSKYADRVVIPVVMVSHACMTNMMDRFSAEKGYIVAIRAIPGYYDLVKYLIPLIAVVAFCFVVLCISLAVRVCRERRHLAKKRLSKRNLKKLPVKKFRKGDAEESCAICIDDFVDGEKLRVLPCNHAYHCKCIDPWLTKVRKVCPICKRKVLSSGESDSSDSDNDGRDSTSASVPTAAYRENAPLLRNAEAFASGNPSSLSQRAGLRRNMQGGRRPPLRVIIASPTDTPLPAPGVGYLTATSAEIHGTGAISSRIEAVSETLRRTLRPYYQQIVSRSIRVPWRNATREPIILVENNNPVIIVQECQPGSNAQRPFVVDNNAFDESNEALNIEGSSIVDRRDSEAAGIFPSEGIPVSERNRCLIAASSRLTYADPELEVEISNENQLNTTNTEKVYTTEPVANVSVPTRHGVATVSTNLISTVDGSIEHDLNIGEQALMDEFEAVSSIQQEHD
uniref:RING-type domain-containing protein n=1 Tax=Elaeophora elaphi TaxID=1147741 RepID=A0A0R3RZU9_9BILA